MNLKLNILMLNLLIFIISCNQNSPEINKISLESVRDIKQLIIYEYNKFDSIYFTNNQNLRFRMFVDNELDTLDLYYTNIVDNFKIKNITCPYTNFEFVLIFINNNVYYIGFSDKYIYSEVLLKDTSYYKEGFYLISSKDSIQYINSDREISVFNKIFKEQLSFLDKEPTAKMMIDNIEIGMNLIYESYQTLYEGVFWKPKLENFIDLEGELYNLKGKYDTTDLNIQLINNKYELLSYFFLDKRAYFFKEEKKGIYIFYFEYFLNELVCEKTFIPNMECINL